MFIALYCAELLAPAPWIPMTAFTCPCLGLVLERWHFFTKTNHPQNLYYPSN